jgi:glycosyltransferase involved in cell wall biosynthesis
MPFVAWVCGDFWTEHHSLFSTARFPSKLLGPPRLFTWSAGLGLADRILTVSSWLRRIVAERFPHKNITVLHRGIDPEDWLVKETDAFDFERPAVGILQDNIILPKVKGLLWFSDVVKAMSDVRFYVAGGGPFTHIVKKAYAGLENVHFVGRLNYPEGVRRFYESTDLFVHASGLDTGPNTVLEAALCERAVVASRVGGVLERVVEGETGWTIPNGETDMWIAKISQLIDDEDLRRRMGSNGRNFVLKNFSWNIQASRLASIFRDTLASH